MIYLDIEGTVIEINIDDCFWNLKILLTFFKLVSNYKNDHNMTEGDISILTQLRRVQT